MSFMKDRASFFKWMAPPKVFAFFSASAAAPYGRSRYIRRPRRAFRAVSQVNPAIAALV